MFIQLPPASGGKRGAKRPKQKGGNNVVVRGDRHDRTVSERSRVNVEMCYVWSVYNDCPLNVYSSSSRSAIIVPINLPKRVRGGTEGHNSVVLAKATHKATQEATQEASWLSNLLMAGCAL